VSNLSQLDIILLQKRADIIIDTGDTICTHHAKVYLDKFEEQQRKCSDPFGAHAVAVKSKLVPIQLQLSEDLSQHLHKKILPGWKLCPRCLGRAQDELFNRDFEQPDNHSDDPDFPKAAKDNVAACLAAVECSPMKVGEIPLDRRLAYGKRKLSQTVSSLQQKMACSLDIDPSNLSINCVKAPECNLCEDYQQLLLDLKAKCAVSSKQEVVQLLTMAPLSWSIDKVAEEFKVSEYLVRKARALHRSDGVLGISDKKQGHCLPKDTEAAVKAFYEDDDVSRICPGKKDYVSVKVNGKKEHIQKRLILCNLNELYASFKEKTSLKIGFSKFCSLRPKWCVTVGASGSHTVCVCTLHQNTKLMLSSVSKKLDYHDMMAMVVCDTQSKQCMIHRCINCPGVNPLHIFLKDTLETDFDFDDDIHFQQWVTTDRTTLITQQCNLEEFIDTAVDKINNLTAHHYISKHQTKYLRKCKDDLKTGSCIIILDFAENYSFVAQDAAQGFHWENSQATLHPFSVYYRNSNGSVDTVSLCIISDHMKHDTVAVHAFQKVVIEHLKQIIKGLYKVIYFSDGAASQYKNFKNFANLLNHRNDHGLEAEWNFFGTSHGKNSCDGIGGTVKRLAARASLQRTCNEHLLTSKQLFDWCTEKINGISFFFVSTTKVDEHAQQLEERFKRYSTFPGTRDNHWFVPLSYCEMKIGRVSGDDDFFIHTTASRNTLSVQVQPKFEAGQYVASVYDQKWYIGTLLEHGEEYDEFYLNSCNLMDHQVSTSGHIKTMSAGYQNHIC